MRKRLTDAIASKLIFLKSKDGKVSKSLRSLRSLLDLVSYFHKKGKYLNKDVVLHPLLRFVVIPLAKHRFLDFHCFLEKYRGLHPYVSFTAVSNNNFPSSDIQIALSTSISKTVFKSSDGRKNKSREPIDEEKCAQVISGLQRDFRK